MVTSASSIFTRCTRLVGAAVAFSVLEIKLRVAGPTAVIHVD